MKKIRGVVDVTTWTDEECGCCWSDDGWWIVNLGCQDHKTLIPLKDRRHAGSSAYSDQYGPFEPPRMRVTRRADLDEEIMVENLAISHLNQKAFRQQR